VTLREFAPSGFFHLRTPLLPFDAFLAWGEGLAAATATGDSLPEALAADRQRQRSRLRAALDDAVVREALFLASPDLSDSLAVWLSEPESERGQRVERALVKYFSRMTARCTPFGLLAATSVGRVGEATRLVPAGRQAWRRHSRLDMDYLFALADALVADPAHHGALVVGPAPSLYEAAGRLRYTQARLDGKERTYHLMGLDTSPELCALLRRAEHGARPDELAAELTDEATSPGEAAELVVEAIRSGVLTPDLGLRVTGPEPLDALVRQLARQEPSTGVADRLREAGAALEAIDRQGVGVPPARYRAIADRLQALPARPELPRLFQVDLVKPLLEAVLGRSVLQEIERGVELLHRLAPTPPPSAMDAFRGALVDRYEEREVRQGLPLVEVLDAESGIGYPPDLQRGSEGQPLLAGVPFAAAPNDLVSFGVRERFLLRLLAGALASGSRELALSDADVAVLPPASPQPLPNAFAVTARIAGSQGEGADFRVLLEGVHGPSGARLLGRFCHADPELDRLVREHLRAEEALEPDALFAEVAHLPEGRIGNILLRPVLRRHEIPFLGGSGAPAECQIPVTDLLVSVRGGTVQLRSRRLARRVVPRLTCSHNYRLWGLPLYRFLCDLQDQGCAGSLAWDWGPLKTSPFLPRVTSGRVVLAAATWNLERERLATIGRSSGAERFRAIDALRRERGLPRHVVVADGDNALPVDLEAALSVETFAHLVKERESVVLQELLPGPDELLAAGPEGRYRHELVIPFVARRPQVSTASPVPPAASMTDSRDRVLAPGSEWLYAKLYASPSEVDRLLLETLAPLVKQSLASGAADRWFFVRYGDPRWHLRLRLHGDPERLHREVLPALQSAVQPLLSSGTVWKLQLDTYERELERYGGVAAMELAELLFHADSETALEILSMLEEGDAGEEERWRLALAGIDTMLDDLGLDFEEKRAAMASARRTFGTEMSEDAGLRRALGARYRRHRRELKSLLARDSAAVESLAPGLEALDRRGERVRPIARRVEALEREGRLGCSRADLATSHVHMSVNRHLRFAHRRQELVLYDLLCRIYEAQRVTG